VRYQTLFIGLLILLTSFLLSCSNDPLQPEDKYPVVTDYNWVANLNVKVTTTPAGWLLTIPDRMVKMTVRVRTYNANQQFTAHVVLERVTRYFEVIDMLTGLAYEGAEDYPFDNFGTPVDEPIDDPHGDPTETIDWDGLVGAYVKDSGAPPQGIVEIKWFFLPKWLPLFTSDWYFIDPTGRYAKGTERYEYLFKVIMEDMGGRTDTFSFPIGSTLLISED
jgi:hypothetical protein